MLVTSTLSSVKRLVLSGFYYPASSGIARATVNLAIGLLEKGIHPAVTALYISKRWMNELEKFNIPTFSAFNSDCFEKVHYKLRLMWDLDYKLARKLNTQLKKLKDEFDLYVVSDDAALSLSKYKDEKRMILWTHGEISMLLLSSAWSRTYIRRLLSTLFVPVLLNHRKLVKNFDFIVANSNLAKELCQFTYEVIPRDIVYLPVNTQTFSPVNEPSNDYFIAVGRSDEGIGIILSELAKRIPLVTIGGLKVPNAKNLGFISDDNMLRDLYSNAIATLHPAMGEYFGYPVAESLACGTPVIAYDAGGPSELISHGENGWLVKSNEDFYEIVMKIYKNGYSSALRKNARESSNFFSIQKSTSKFIELITTFIAQ